MVADPLRPTSEPWPGMEAVRRLIAQARSGDPRIVVDTSAIIDGRIAEIVESGFIYGTLVVPRFVLDELQHIADSSDTLRRNRGRRGLEILNRMQKEPGTPVEIGEDAVPSEAELRIAQAQLVGWLEGVFHGIQTALFAQQMAARAQLEEMRRRAIPGPGMVVHEDDPRLAGGRIGRDGTGQYL